MSALRPIEQDHLPASRAEETHPRRIRARMAQDLADLAALSGGATRDEMLTLGWTSGQLVDHLAHAIAEAGAVAPCPFLPDPQMRPVKRIARPRGANKPGRPSVPWHPAPGSVAGRIGLTALMFLCFASAAVTAIANRPALPARQTVAFEFRRPSAPPPSSAERTCGEEPAPNPRGLRLARLP